MLGRWLVWGASLLALSCGDDDPSAGGGSGGMGSSSSTEECPSVNEGDPCSEPGARCSYGDDCGSWVYECQGGAWVQVDGSGCGADPVPCAAGPMEGDGCGENFGEVCDPDGDCLDVLECEAYSWRSYAVCTEMLCAEAAPVHGKPCDATGRFCDVDHECGWRSFRCWMGYWEFFGGYTCETPLPCSESPVTNDACDQAGEVCPPPVEGWDTLVCDGSTWQPQ